jgi:4-pyridoxate dehydrogenase
VGVRPGRQSEARAARAEREVILAGGVINSPQLLMLSGVGDPQVLRAHGIPINVPLPGVGQNLQDHVSVTVANGRKEPGPLHGKLRADRIAVKLGRAYLRGEGIAADWPGGVMAFLKSTPELSLPDIQLLFNAAPMTAHVYFPPFVPPYADSFGCRAVLLHPESRGRIELASPDPRAPVRIRQNFLATDKD